MKEKLKNSPLKYAVIIARAFTLKPSLSSRITSLISFFTDYKAYRKMESNQEYKLSTADLFPRIFDKTVTHEIDPVYFIQGCWCARKVFKASPRSHVDVGSQALMVGIISQYTPTTMVDIRPLSLSMPGLSFIKGDITSLPFKNNEIDSLSSICVIEHIGLGRYGDPLDQFGTEKAATELSRVLAKNGNLYISVPVDAESKTYFNAHRAFTRNRVLALFPSLTLIEESYIYGRDIVPSYDGSRFGTGLYHLKKI